MRDASKTEKMGERKYFITAVLIVIANGMVIYFMPDKGLFLTPFVLLAVTYLVGLAARRTNVIFTAVLTFFFVALNGFFIRMSMTGTEDHEDIAVLSFVVSVGLIGAALMFTLTTLNRKTESLSKQLFSILLFLVLNFIQLRYFVTWKFGDR
jgi:hypothetical protein